MTSPIPSVIPSLTPMSDYDAGAAIIGGIFAGGLLLFFWGLVLWTVVLIDILKSEFIDSNNKIIWLIVTLLLPFLGPLLYLLVGKKQVKKGTGINLKAVFTVISFFIWFPLGTILMWFWTNWPKWLKVTITILTILALSFVVFAKYLL